MDFGLFAGGEVLECGDCGVKDRSRRMRAILGIQISDARWICAAWKASRKLWSSGGEGA